MPSHKYDLIDDQGQAVALEMDLGVAMCLLSALMEKYYEEKDISYTIARHVYEVEALHSIVCP